MGLPHLHSFLPLTIYLLKNLSLLICFSQCSSTVTHLLYILQISSQTQSLAQAEEITGLQVARGTEYVVVSVTLAAECRRTDAFEL